MDLREEAEYRLSLAESNLRDSKKFLDDKLYHWAVLSAQLSVENSAKAVISCFRIPSWLHDPSLELEDVLRDWKDDISSRFEENIVEALKRLAETASELAPDHGRATYGIIERRVLPSEIYGEPEAQRAVCRAEEGCKTADRFVKKWFQ